MNDTICAISTAMGIGAISIIRVSGADSINIVNSITKTKKLIKKKSHTINYDFIVDNNKLIDEVLISVMKAPKTFTKENIVEINCHGGIVTTNKILELLLLNGCRLSEPGEFTKRAFLNGRIDLIKAEGIMDLINSKTEKAHALALNQLSGKVSNLIISLRNHIINILANIEVNIDYPEYEDIEEVTLEMIKNEINIIEVSIKEIIKKSENGQIIKNGINIVLLGRPNVGKSSILNGLLETEKAIVTDIAGTTRDIIEGQISLDGIYLNIIDTAGIRDTSDKIEKIGVNRSLEAINKSELILLILDNNKEISIYDQELLKKIENKKYLIVINKNDLPSNLNINKLPINKIVYTDTISDNGLEKLKNRIREEFNLEQIETDDVTYLTNARGLAILKRILNSLDQLKMGVNSNLPIDILEIDLKEIWSLLGEIIGENYSDELIDQLFSQFCLGK